MHLTFNSSCESHKQKVTFFRLKVILLSNLFVIMSSLVERFKDDSFCGQKQVTINASRERLKPGANYRKTVWLPGAETSRYGCLPDFASLRPEAGQRSPEAQAEEKVEGREKTIRLMKEIKETVLSHSESRLLHPRGLEMCSTLHSSWWSSESFRCVTRHACWSLFHFCLHLCSRLTSFRAPIRSSILLNRSLTGAPKTKL